MSVTADMRERYGVTISAVDRRVITWGEYRNLMDDLCMDPTTRTFAELAGWSERMSEAWLLRQLLASWVPENFPWPWVAKQASLDADAVREAKANLLQRSPLLRGLVDARA